MRSGALAPAVHEPARPPEGLIPEGAARRYSSEPARPPEGLIPEGAARRYSSEPARPPEGLITEGAARRSPSASAALAAPTALHPGFSAEERRYLLGRPGIGPGVLARLEACGYASLAQLRTAGVDEVLEAITLTLGPDRWSNRRRALAQALQDA